jgi:hypothetical protein
VFLGMSSYGCAAHIDSFVSTAGDEMHFAKCCGGRVCQFVQTAGEVNTAAAQLGWRIF